MMLTEYNAMHGNDESYWPRKMSGDGVTKRFQEKWKSRTRFSLALQQP